jgi:tRNA(adenine34) deaminase
MLADRPESSRYVNDLPSLDGLRLHYIDAGLPDALQTLMCLHGPTDWSYVWRSWAIHALSRNQRVICPDMIGFGQSDKPKKESTHTLAWHVQIFLELIDRLDLRSIMFIADDRSSELAQRIQQGASHKIAKVQFVRPDSLNALALAAPFPDNGHRAALRAFAQTNMSHMITSNAFSA